MTGAQADRGQDGQAVRQGRAETPTLDGTQRQRCARSFSESARWSFSYATRSVQAWHFQEAVAVRGGDAHLEHATGAVDCEGNLNTRLAQRPDTPEEACQRPNGPARDSEHDVARFNTGLFGGSLRGQTNDDNLVLGFTRIEPEPGSRRPIGPPKPRHVIKDRGEQINGNNHVKRQGPTPRGGVLELERADAQQLATRADQGRAAPLILLANSAGCWGQGTGEDAHRRECPVLEALIPPCQAANASVLGPPNPARRIRQQHPHCGWPGAVKIASSSRYSQ